jgi:hypothetical protein
MGYGSKSYKYIWENNMTDCIKTFLTLQSQLRILHWQTGSFAEHKALGKAYDGLDGLIDSFVETYMGKHGKAFNGNMTLEIFNYGEAQPMAVMRHAEDFLMGDLEEELDKEKDSELLNIRDEMLSVVNTTKYLLTLS